MTAEEMATLEATTKKARLQEGEYEEPKLLIGGNAPTGMPEQAIEVDYATEVKPPKFFLALIFFMVLYRYYAYCSVSIYSPNSTYC